MGWVPGRSCAGHRRCDGFPGRAGAGGGAVCWRVGGLRRAAGAAVEPVRWWRRLGQPRLVTRWAVRVRGEFVITVEGYNSDTLDLASDRLH